LLGLSDACAASNASTLSRKWKESSFVDLTKAYNRFHCEQPEKIIHTSLHILEAHGLDPDHYRPSPFSAQKCTLSRQLLSKAILDLQFGRGSLLAKDPKRNAQAEFYAGILWNYAILSPKQAHAHLPYLVQQAAPKQEMYTRLQRAYSDYLQLARKGGFPVIAEGQRLTLGKADSRLEKLRRYLILTGDYSLEQWSSSHLQAIFDKSLQAALMRFQQRHGLSTDGLLGKETLRALNTPISRRLEQMALTLERMRRATPARGDFIHVNLPGFKLYAYAKGKPALEMKVIIGEKSNPTPEFSNQITQVVLNPTWTPTHRILQNEMLPKARSNPSSLNGYRITDRRTGQALDPLQINWQTVSASDVHVEQPAGQGNALGKVKFLMPKSDSIYLHDTARPQLFQQAYRALSHGCIRLEKPKELAKFVFNLSRPDEAATLERRYEESASRSYSMITPLPVITTYYTAWVNDEGQPEFYQDIYGKDAPLHAELEQFQPRHATAQLASR
jgi:murein L,D-transpeptidase YcbB/YkuD